MRWRPGLSEFEFAVVHLVGTKHQVVDAVERLKTTSEDETPNEDDIFILCITPSNPPKKEARCMYMEEDVKERDKRGVGLPKV